MTARFSTYDLPFLNYCGIDIDEPVAPIEDPHFDAKAICEDMASRSGFGPGVELAFIGTVAAFAGAAMCVVAVVQKVVGR